MAPPDTVQGRIFTIRPFTFIFFQGGLGLPAYRVGKIFRKNPLPRLCRNLGLHSGEETGKMP